MGVAVGFAASPFFGFSIAWLSVFIVVAGMAINILVGLRKDRVQLAGYVFPVHVYHTSTSTVQRANTGPALVCMATG